MMRLAKLLPERADKFGDTVPAEEIRAAVDAVLADYTDVQDRSFVLSLAYRRARDLLREDDATAPV